MRMTKDVVADSTIVKIVPFDAIDPHAFPNCRTHLDPTKVERLKASIKESGLLEPLTVTNGGDTYALTKGFNRYAALKELGYKEVRVEVRTYPKSDPLAPFIDNLTENVSRDDVHPADLSKRLGEIVSGVLLQKSAEDPLEEPKFDRKLLARKIGMSIAHFGNLLRADQKCTEEVKAAWRRFDVPSGLIFELSTFAPEEQAEKLATWLEERQALLDSGRKRKPNKAKAKKDGGKGKGKKESEDEGHDRATVSELRSALGRCLDKVDTGKTKGADLAFIKGKIRGLELALGDISIETFNRSY